MAFAHFFLGERKIMLNRGIDKQELLRIVDSVANEKSIKSYAILGFDGGKCRDLATVPIHFEINDMLISEDIQMIVFNICFQWIVKIKNR